MEFLKGFFLTGLLTFGLLAKAEVIFCSSGDELKKSFHFFDGQKNLEMSEKLKFKLATEVAKGCTGAADRFQRVFECLQKVGVDPHKALQISLEFSKLDDDRTTNFIEIFRQLFLSQYFDSDFNSAYQISLELSKDLKTQTSQTRKDFLRVVDLCLNNKDFHVGIPRCAKISIEIAKISSQYPEALSQNFEELFRFFRKDIGLDVDTSLKLLPKVLSEGPTAVQNFRESYLLLSQRASLGLNPEQSVRWALKMTKSSKRESDVPIIR